jgi:septum formation protein
MDKAGAYAIQGKGSFLIESYNGSYSNIIGLPMDLLKDLLQKLNCSI